MCANSVRKLFLLETCYTSTLKPTSKNIILKIINKLHNKGRFVDTKLLAGDKQLCEYIVKAPEFGPKCHKCTLCGKTSSDRSNLRRHVEKKHFKGAFIYRCKYCLEEFDDTKTNLNNHNMRVCKKSIT